MTQLDPEWQRLALEPPRAHGAPLGTGTIRAQPEDFLVEEELHFSPSGTGQHWLLRVRKRSANTQWVARQLARIAGCRPADVGYAGLKDRDALAAQWFSVPKGSFGEEWVGVRTPEFEVLEAHPHSRKLPRGALGGNRFLIRIRDFTGGEEAFAERCEQLVRLGVPNYFGPQRFGVGGSNLLQIAAGLAGLRTEQRGFVLSAARSLIFNAVLTARVLDRTWNRLEVGDLANLDDRGSFFAVDALDSTLAERCERGAIHPTGPMFGAGPALSSGRVLELEEAVLRQLSAPASLLTAAGLAQERRPLRMRVRDLEWRWETGAVVVSFRLGKGSFATAALRELL